MEYWEDPGSWPAHLIGAILATGALLAACATSPAAAPQRTALAAAAFKAAPDFPAAVLGKTVRVDLECCGPWIAYFSPNDFDIFIWTPESRNTLVNGLSNPPNEHTVCFGAVNSNGIGSYNTCFDFGDWVSGVKEIVDGDILHLSVSRPPWMLKSGDGLSIAEICALTLDGRCSKPLETK